jgi:hypothetical protein
MGHNLQQPVPMEEGIYGTLTSGKSLMKLLGSSIKYSQFFQIPILVMVPSQQKQLSVDQKNRGIRVRAGWRFYMCG